MSNYSKNSCTFAPDFERELHHNSQFEIQNYKLPHSSSGPGQLPLTQ